MNWWQRLRHRAQMEHDLDRELRFHFESLVADFIRDGMTAEAARRRARLEFGGLDQMKEECRDARGTRWVHELAQDLRFAARLFVKERGLTMLAIVALGLGIGVNNTLFTILDGTVLRGLTVSGIDRLVDISTLDRAGRPLPVDQEDLRLLGTTVPAVSSVAGYTTRSGTIGDADRAPDRLVSAFVTPNVTALIGLTPQIGRTLTEADDRAGAPPVVVLDASVWRDRYGSDPSIVGRSVLLDGAPTTVIGIMREGLRFPDRAGAWRPLSALPGTGDPPGSARVTAFARLSDGATIASAAAQVQTVAAELARRRPAAATPARWRVKPLNDRYKGDITNPAWIAFMTVGILLVLIACSNVANLLLARAVRRSREIAIRLSIGATRGRILRQLAAESLLLGALGGAAGLGLSAIGVRLFKSAIPPDGLPYWMDYTMDTRVLAVLALVCLGTVGLFGLAPALHTLRAGLNDPLKDAAPTMTTGYGARRLSGLFLTTQLAIATVLLSAMGLSVGAFLVERQNGPRVPPSDILTLRLTLPARTYETADARAELYRDVQTRVTRLGGVVSATVCDALPFGGASGQRLTLDDDHEPAVQRPLVPMQRVDEAYFGTIGLTLLQGRLFTTGDTARAAGGAVVNQRFARMFFPSADPIGRHIRLSADGAAPGPALTIVGVVSSIPQGPRHEADPLVYVPLGAAPRSVVVLVHGAGDAAALAPRVREAVRQLDPRLPLYDVRTLDRAAWEARWNARVSQRLITVIALIALGLTTVGLAGLTAHAVSQRRHEIGLRMALGAARGQVMRLVLRRVSVQIGIGLIVGIGAAIAWRRVFGPAGAAGLSMLNNLATVCVIIMAVTMAACVWPARRAATIDPLRALRHE